MSIKVKVLAGLVCVILVDLIFVNRRRIDMKTVVAICIGMHLHPLLSNHLIESAGLSFRYVVPEHATYQFFVTGYYGHSVDECNEMLHAQGFKSLSGDE